jgi:hypothetical protein
MGPVRCRRSWWTRKGRSPVGRFRAGTRAGLGARCTVFVHSAPRSRQAPACGYPTEKLAVRLSRVVAPEAHASRSEPERRTVTRVER